MLLTVNLCSCFLNGIQHAINKAFKGLAFMYNVGLLNQFKWQCWLSLNFCLTLKEGIELKKSGQFIMIRLFYFVSTYVAADSFGTIFCIRNHNVQFSIVQCCHLNWFRTDMKEMLKNCWYETWKRLFEIHIFSSSRFH